MTVSRRLLLVAGVFLLAEAGLADEAADRIRVQEQAFSKSMVWIKFVMAPEEGDATSGTCSGVAIAHGEGCVIVAPDVQGAVSSIRILLSDGKEVEGELLGRDEDLGFLFVVPKRVEEAKAIPAMAPGKGKTLALGDAFLLVDRRSPAAPEETTCLFTRVICALPAPRQGYFYSGMSPAQVGGLAVTLSGEVVGMVGLLKTSGADGEDESSVALLPVERILDSLSSLGAKP